MSKLTASGTTKSSTVKFSLHRGGQGQGHAVQEVRRRSSSARARRRFTAKDGSTSKTVTKTLAKGSYRVDVVVTDADKVASDVKSKTFKVS